MNAAVALRTAWRALRKNALRSLLAALGIVIAVAAVEATVALGQGAQAKVRAQMTSLGTNLLFVSAGASKSRGLSAGAGSGRTLAPADGDAIAHELGHLVAALAPVSRTSAQVVFRDTNWSTLVVGTTASYLQVRAWALASGAFFGHDDDTAGAKVCVLGHSVATQLFGEADPLGETVRVKSMPCRVIGVLQAKGQGGWGQDQDDVLLMPFTTLTHRLLRLQNNVGLTFQVAARTPELAGPLQDEIGALLRQRHHLAAGADDDFSVFNLSEMQQAAQQQTQTLSYLLGSVALISLLVGAIGIANVMLVSVTERTREIGIRMAVGARSRDVLLQFLVEALLLCCLGGVLGLALGAGLAAVLARQGDWPVMLAPEVMLATLALAAGAGVVAGFYPALRAARLDPIEALRHE